MICFTFRTLSYCFIAEVAAGQDFSATPNPGIKIASLEVIGGPDSLFQPLASLELIGGPDSLLKPLASLEFICGPCSLSKPLSSLKMIIGTTFQPLASFEVIGGQNFSTLSLRSKELVDKSLFLSLSLRSRLFVDQTLFMSSTPQGLLQATSTRIFFIVQATIVRHHSLVWLTQHIFLIKPLRSHFLIPTDNQIL